MSTGVRGKATTAPADQTLVAMDHDMTNASLTPSVILQVQLKPDASVDDSFVRGKVRIILIQQSLQENLIEFVLNY